MSQFKTIPKQFKCSITNSVETVDYTYQLAGELNGLPDYVFSKRTCRKAHQCSLAGLYDKCSLKGTPCE